MASIQSGVWQPTADLLPLMLASPNITICTASAQDTAAMRSMPTPFQSLFDSVLGLTKVLGQDEQFAMKCALLSCLAPGSALNLYRGSLLAERGILWHKRCHHALPLMWLHNIWLHCLAGVCCTPGVLCLCLSNPCAALFAQPPLTTRRAQQSGRPFSVASHLCPQATTTSLAHRHTVHVSPSMPSNPIPPSLRLTTCSQTHWTDPAANFAG